MSGDLNDKLARTLQRLRARRAEIDAEIAQVQGLGSLATAPTPDFILGLYMTLGSAAAAADFANAQGWRLPSKKGPDHPSRKYQPNDVYALLRGEPNQIGQASAAVRETALRALTKRGGWTEEE